MRMHSRVDSVDAISMDMTSQPALRRYRNHVGISPSLSSQQSWPWIEKELEWAIYRMYEIDGHSQPLMPVLQNQRK